MSTIRVQHRRRFTTVDRRSINDATLSFRARGLLMWLLDKPDGWRVNSTQIAAASREGRDAIRAALAELERAGYLRRARSQAKDGRWTTESILWESPPTEDGIPGASGPGASKPGANTNTDTDDCYPQTPLRSRLCAVCAATPEQSCRIVEAEMGELDACPWRQ